MALREDVCKSWLAYEVMDVVTDECRLLTEVLVEPSGNDNSG